jgi:dTDP-4-amino-4,6-dideoxygalactose transaminase
MTADVYSLGTRYFVAAENNVWVASLPVQLSWGSRQDAPRHLAYSTLMGPAGPFVSRSLQAKPRHRALEKLTQAAVEWATSENVERVTCSLPPLAPSNLGNARGVNPLVTVGWTDRSSTHTRIAGLRASEDALWRALPHGARESVKRALNAGYRVARGNWQELVDEYYQVHVETYTRTGVPPHPKAYFEGIARRIAPLGHAVLWVAHDAHGRPVAFHNCARFGHGSLYWTGCSRTDHLRSGANHLLVWHALLGAKEDNCRFYELGEAFPEAKDGRLQGLTRFKSMFAGELYRFFRGEIRVKPPRQRSPRRAPTTPQVRRSGPGRIAFVEPYWGPEEIEERLREDGSEGDAREVASTFLSRLQHEGLTVATSSGRTALSVALRSLRQARPDRDHVILPTYSCRGVLDPIIQCGLRPVLVDTGADLNLEASSVTPHMSDRTLAVVVVHLGGAYAVEVDAIAEAAGRRGVAIIEDLCQALGGHDAEGYWGTDAPMAIYSFGLGKNITATAGGMLVARTCLSEVRRQAGKLKSEDPAAPHRRFDHILSAHHHAGVPRLTPPGQRPVDAYESAYGYHRMRSLDARLLHWQLQRMAGIVEARQRNAGLLLRALGGQSSITAPAAHLPHVWTKFTVLADSSGKARRLRALLARRGIETETMYTPLHLRDCGRGHQAAPLPVSESIWRRAFNLPVRPSLSDEEMQYIAYVTRRAASR